MNRKERYFTGTVLPGLVSDNGFAHLHRFLALCGLDVGVDDLNSHALEGMQDIQFFTEYSFADSVHADRDRERFADRPHDRDAPDIVIAGPDWLVAVEAKMYHRPSRQALQHQLASQRPIIDYWTHKFGFDPARVLHILLLPEPLARDRQPLSSRVITWEQVLDAYGTVGSAYWFGVLRSALDRYEELASPEPTFRTNADALMLGEEILEAHASGSLIYAWVGRFGGANGKALAEDIATNTWRQRSYEVRVDPLAGNTNWLPVGEFVAKTI